MEREELPWMRLVSSLRLNLALCSRAGQRRSCLQLVSPKRLSDAVVKPSIYYACNDYP